MRKYYAEFIGTFILVFFAVGSAVFGFNLIGATGVALAFGFVLLALAYAIGPISGCHVNPAVTVGMLVARRISPQDAMAYIAAQVAGGILGGGLLFFMVRAGGVTDQTGALGTNTWGKGVNLGGALILEVVLTFLLVFVVLLVTGRTENAALAGVAIGLTLAVIHLAGIPLTGTSVNPARSIGPALFAGVAPIKHLWLFIVAPLAGGALAALVYPMIAGRVREAAEWDTKPDAEAEPTRTPGRPTPTPA